MDIIENIKFVLNKIRPFIINDGGDVEFVRFDEKTGTVFVKLTGSCANCSYADYTISDTIEEVLTSEIPDVLHVKQVSDISS